MASLHLPHGGGRGPGSGQPGDLPASVRVQGVLQGVFQEALETPPYSLMSPGSQADGPEAQRWWDLRGLHKQGGYQGFTELPVAILVICSSASCCCHPSPPPTGDKSMVAESPQQTLGTVA